MVEKNYEDSLFVNVPAFIGKNKEGAPIESVRPWEFTDAETGKTKNMVEIKLPYGTSVDTIQPDGTKASKDVSYHTFSISAAQLDPGPDGQKYPSTHSILFNKVNSKTDEPWTVRLQGPSVQAADGQWIAGETVEVTTEDLKTGCREQYEARKEAKAQAKEQQTASQEMPKSEERGLDAEAKDMSQAKDAQVGEYDAQAPKEHDNDEIPF